MFAKSKKNAVFMACIFVISAVMIAFVVGEVRYFVTPPAERNPMVVNGFTGVGPVLIAVAVLFLSISIAASVIYQLNESHYGRQGAIRWASAGLLYGLLQQIVLTPIPSDFDFQVVSVVRQIGGDLLWKVLTLVLSYLVIFPLCSLVLSWHHNLHQGKWVP